MTRTTCKPHQSEGGPPGWWKEIATTQLGGSGAAAGPHKGASRGARDTRPIGATGAREVPPGGCIEGVWSSGPTGLPPYVARARVARPTPGGQRGARAWPEKPKGNERKRESRSVALFFRACVAKVRGFRFFFSPAPRVTRAMPPPDPSPQPLALASCIK